MGGSCDLMRGDHGQVIAYDDGTRGRLEQMVVRCGFEGAVIACDGGARGRFEQICMDSSYDVLTLFYSPDAQVSAHPPNFYPNP